jgi:hypothetical protein
LLVEGSFIYYAKNDDTMLRIGNRYNIDSKMIKALNPHYHLTKALYAGTPIVLAPEARSFVDKERQERMALRQHVREEQESDKARDKAREKAREKQEREEDSNLRVLSNVAAYTSLLPTGLRFGGSVAAQEDYSQMLAELETKFLASLWQHGISSDDMQPESSIDNWPNTKLRQLVDANRAFLHQLSNW